MSASYSIFSICSFLHCWEPTDILHQSLEQSQKQKAGSCRAPLPASKLTLPRTKRLIIHAYMLMGTFLQSPVFSLGGGMLEVLLPWNAYGRDISVWQCLPFPLPGDELLQSLTSVDHICHHLLNYVKGTHFFQLKLKQSRVLPCFVWLQNVSPDKANKYMDKHLALLHMLEVTSLLILHRHWQGETTFIVRS